MCSPTPRFLLSSGRQPPFGLDSKWSFLTSGELRREPEGCGLDMAFGEMPAAGGFPGKALKLRPPSGNFLMQSIMCEHCVASGAS